jgi:hypothetical protein
MAALGDDLPDLQGIVCRFPARGLPETLITDNGGEFRGGAMKAALDYEPAEADFIPDERHRTAMTQLGVRTIQCIAFNPESKPEAWFRSMADDENQLPGYTGRNAKEKPEALKRQIDMGSLLTLDQYRAWFSGYVARRALHHPIGPRRLVPRAYWDAFQPQEIDPRHLDDMLSRDRWITIGNKLLSLKNLGTYAPVENDRPAYVECIGYRCRLLYRKDNPSVVTLIRKAADGRLIRAACRRLPVGDDWGLALGRGPSEAFREVQAINGIARTMIRDSARELVQGVDPAELDPTGAWRAASANAASDRHARIAAALPAPAPARAPAPPLDELAAAYAATVDDDPLGLNSEPARV